MYINGAGVETVYIVSPLPYSSYVYTYFRSIEQIYSTLQISTVTKSITRVIINVYQWHRLTYVVLQMID